MCAVKPIFLTKAMMISCFRTITSPFQNQYDFDYKPFKVDYELLVNIKKNIGGNPFGVIICFQYLSRYVFSACVCDCIADGRDLINGLRLRSGT